MAEYILNKEYTVDPSSQELGPSAMPIFLSGSHLCQIFRLLENPTTPTNDHGAWQVTSPLWVLASPLCIVVSMTIIHPALGMLCQVNKTAEIKAYGCSQHETEAGLRKVPTEWLMDGWKNE